MILEVAILQVRAGQGAAFEAAFRTAAPIVAGSPGHLSHELQRCHSIPDRYLLLVRWETLAHHTEGFRSTIRFRTCSTTS